MEKSYEINWTDEANENVAIIFEFLIQNWNKKVADDFLELLIGFEKNISIFSKVI